MRSFTDAKGRSWEIVVDVYGIRRVRDLLKIDLQGIWEKGKKSLSEIIEDCSTVIDVVYVLCKDKADELGISDMDFGRGIGGDNLQAAADALEDEIINFTPSPTKRATLKKVMKKEKQAEAIRSKVVDEKISEMSDEKIEQEFKEILEKAIKKESHRAQQANTGTTSLTPAQEFLASTQHDSPSAN